MAYWVAQSQADGANGSYSTYSVDMPTGLITGDLIVCHMSTRGTASITPPTGYTLVNASNPTTKTGDDYNYLAYKISDGTETQATFSLTSGTSNMCISVDLFRDTGGVVATAETHDNTATTTKIFPDVTPTSNDDLWIGVMSIDGHAKGMLMERQTGVPYPFDAPVVSGYFYTRRTVNVATCQLHDTTAIGASFVTQHESDQTSLFSIIISNSTGGLTSPQIQVEKSLFQPLGGLTGNPTYSNPTWTSLHSDVSTINGGTVVDASLNLPSGASFSNLDNSLPTQNFSRISFGNFGTVEDHWQGATIPLTIDLSGGKVFHSSFSEPNTQRSKENGYIFIDSSGNWSVFTLKKSNIKSGKEDNIIIVSENSPPRYSSVTACDMSDITKVGILCLASSLSNNTILVPYMQVIDKITFLGLNASRLHEIGFLNRSKYVDGIVSLQGFTQTQWRVSIQIGDGSTETFIDLSTSSIEFQGNDGVLNFINAEDLELTLKLSANDTFNNGAITSSSGVFNYVLDPATSSLATYNFDNTTILNSLVTWETSIDVNAQNFIGCAVIDAKGATFTNCNISKSQSTTHAMTIDAGANITGTSFIKNDETYAIEIPNAGAYDLSDSTFSGYTTELNITAATGTVTISLSLGQSEPTYATAGATVVFNFPQLTASITGIVAGSRLQIYNTTTATEVVNQVIAGTSYSANYNEGTDYTLGDIIRVRLTCQSGATACDWFETNVLASESGWSVLAAQESLTAYSSLGVDGSTVIEYSLDGTNIQIDANDTDGTSTKKRLVAWYYYAGTLEEGIRSFFGGIELEDDANAVIRTSVVDLTIDNISSRQLRLSDTDFRLYRDDSSTIIKYPSTGGYGIDIDAGKVFITNAGDLWNVDVVNGSFAGGSAASLIKNLPRVIARNKEL